MAGEHIVWLEEGEGIKISLITKQQTNHFHVAVAAITRGQSIYLGLDFICLKGVELNLADSEHCFASLQSKLINLHI